MSVRWYLARRTSLIVSTAKLTVYFSKTHLAYTIVFLHKLSWRRQRRNMEIKIFCFLKSNWIMAMGIYYWGRWLCFGCNRLGIRTCIYIGRFQNEHITTSKITLIRGYVEFCTKKKKKTGLGTIKSFIWFWTPLLTVFTTSGNSESPRFIDSYIQLGCSHYIIDHISQVSGCWFE